MDNDPLEGEIMSKSIKFEKDPDPIQIFIDANADKLERYKVGTDGIEFEAKEGEDLDFTGIKQEAQKKGFKLKEEK